MSTGKSEAYPDVMALEALGINLGADEARLGVRLMPQFAELENGTTVFHENEDGADYAISQVDYRDYHRRRGSPVLASRMIATILAGNRAELLYMTQAAPVMELTAHRGRGIVTIGTPEDAMPEDRPALAQDTQIYHMHPSVLPNVTVQPGRFYAIEAALPSPEPFVVSSLYIPDREAEVDPSTTEIYLKPGQKAVMAPEPEGVVNAPDAFVKRFSPKNT